MVVDELSLIFTGSRTTPNSDIKTTTTTEVEDDAGAGEGSGTSTPIPGEGIEEQTPLTMKAEIHPILLRPSSPKTLFAAEKLGIDRRLIVNRKRQLKMYRVWMQGVFRKFG